LVDEISTNTTYFHKGTTPSSILLLAATGVIASSAILGQQYPSLAFAQEELGITDTTTATDNATGTAAGDTTNATTTGGGNKLAGIIASLQLAPDRLAPEWVTAGYWELESDMPLFGAGSEGTEPTVTSFDAVVEMTKLADGTDLHTHTHFQTFSNQLFYIQPQTLLQSTAL